MSALAKAPSSGYGQEKVIWEASRRYGETLYWGNRSGQVRLYDKHEQSGGDAPEGTVRFEVEARRQWARRYFPTVSDLDAVAVDRIARDMWTRSGFGTPFRALPSWLASLVQDESLTGTVIRGFVGELLLHENGIALPISHTTKAKHKRLIGSHGVPYSHNSGGLNEAYNVSRLDPESGEEVLVQPQTFSSSALSGVV